LRSPAGALHHRVVDHLDRAVRAVRPPAAGLQAKTGIKVRVVALGTGQALDTARRGDADVVFVHDKAAEEKFVAEGFGVRGRT
jgi:ABC-type tungstate transport system permease subunit